MSLPISTGTVATKGLELLAFGTPNSHKILILLEELRDVYGVDYTLNPINLRAGIHKEPWFRALNPTAKVPVLVDHDASLTVPETQAITVYLLQRYDRDNHLTPADPKDRTRAIVWASFSNSELGPASVNSIEFYRRRGAAPELAFAKQHFVGALEHHYGVLERALAGRDYLVGAGRGAFSAADVACFSFVYHAPLAGLDAELGAWPSVRAWVERIKVRPAVGRALAMPLSLGWDYDTYKAKMEKDEAFRESEGKLKAALVKAQEEFGYRYQAP